MIICLPLKNQNNRLADLFITSCQHRLYTNLERASVTSLIENDLFLDPLKWIQFFHYFFHNTIIAMLEPWIISKQWLVRVGLSHCFCGNLSP